MYKNTRKLGMAERLYHKILLIMRLTTVILIASLMQVSAAGFAQKINLSRSNASLKTIIRELRLQSGYDFVYNDKVLNAAKPVSINVKDAKIEDVLEQIFSKQELTYSIDSKTVIIKEPEISLIEKVKDKITGFFLADSVIYRGKILDELGRPLAGATVKRKGENRVASTNERGEFSIYGPRSGAVFVVSYIGYAQRELRPSSNGEVIEVKMQPSATDLEGVEIVENGYQQIAKDRASGSFEVITAKQLQHSNSPNLLKRLEGITTALDFNNFKTATNSAEINNAGQRQSGITYLTIRGRNSLNQPAVVNSYTAQQFNTSGQVLVVIDGIASPYSIDQVNPDDVETITILRDAASASIWGSKAANGVIVITTKRGKYNTPLNISFNSNVNVTEKMDLFYKQRMSVSEYIDAERFMFNKQYSSTNPIPDATLASTQRAYLVTPVYEILNRQVRGQITQAQAEAELNVLRGMDVRNDYTKYFLRNAVNQNYSLGISGGSKVINYNLSGRLANTINNTMNSDNDNKNLNFRIFAKPIKNLELNGTVSYANTRSNDQDARAGTTNRLSGTPEGNASLLPYSQLAGVDGNALEVPWEYRPSFITLLETTYGNQLLNLRNKPLDNINEGYNKTISKNVGINIGADYKIFSWMRLNLSYNYNISTDEGKNLSGQNSFYMRDLINQYYAFPTSTSTTRVRNLPVGGQYTTYQTQSSNQTLRGVANFDKTFGKHSVSGIVGLDVADRNSLINNNQYWGYDQKNLTVVNNLDYKTTFTTLYSTNLNLPFAAINAPSNQFIKYRNRTLGLFSNAGYTFDGRYTVNVGMRRDASSDFGLGSNKYGTPFWYAGAVWAASNEKFYKLAWLPKLSVRANFGYNGNVNPQVYGFPLLNYPYGYDSTTGLPSASANGVSNFKLRPEKSGTLNVGLDFATKNSRFSGSLEHYDSRTTGMISNFPLNPTTGSTSALINTANIHRWGKDVNLNYIVLQGRKFNWTSNFLFSHNRVKVTKIYNAPSIATTASTIVNSTSFYQEGFDINRMFAYKWAGLDPNTGDPRGYGPDGTILTISADATGNANFNKIINTSYTSLKYIGSSSPIYKGSFRNSFSYGGFNISAMMLYNLGYYSRRSVNDHVRYSALFSTSSSRPLQAAEFSDRWQQPGDEINTNVPSFVYPVSSSRDNFYTFSEANVFRADHIRLQEINLSYAFKKPLWGFRGTRVYGNVTNLGILWRANKLGIDPDVYDYPNPRTYSIGFSTNFR